MVIPAQAGIQFFRCNLGPGSFTKISQGDRHIHIVPAARNRAMSSPL